MCDLAGLNFVAGDDPTLYKKAVVQLSHRVAVARNLQSLYYHRNRLQHTPLQLGIQT